jgi:hypothetical protein
MDILPPVRRQYACLVPHIARQNLEHGETGRQNKRRIYSKRSFYFAGNIRAPIGCSTGSEALRGEHRASGRRGQEPNDRARGVRHLGVACDGRRRHGVELDLLGQRPHHLGACIGQNLADRGDADLRLAVGDGLCGRVAGGLRPQLGLRLLRDPELLKQALEIGRAGAGLDIGDDFADCSARLKPSTVLMSGLGAPLRAARPKPAFAISRRSAALSLPCPISASIWLGAMMATSNFAPLSISALSSVPAPKVMSSLCSLAASNFGASSSMLVLSAFETSILISAAPAACGCTDANARKPAASAARVVIVSSLSPVRPAHRAGVARCGIPPQPPHPLQAGGFAPSSALRGVIPRARW